MGLSRSDRWRPERGLTDLRLPSRLQRTAAASWPVLIFRLAEGRRLSWHEWFHANKSYIIIITKHMQPIMPSVEPNSRQTANVQHAWRDGCLLT